MRNFLKYFKSKKTEQDLRYAASKLIQQVKEENMNKKLGDWNYIERSSTQCGYLMPLNTPHAEDFTFNLSKKDLDVLHSYDHLNDREFQEKVHSVYLEVFLRTEKDREKCIPSLQNEFVIEKSNSSIRKFKSLTKDSPKLISSQTSMSTPIKEARTSKKGLKNNFSKDFTPDFEIQTNQRKLGNLFQSEDIRFTRSDINSINGKKKILQEDNLCAEADKSNFVTCEKLSTPRMSAGNDRTASNSIKNNLELSIPSDSSVERSSDSIQNSTIQFHSSRTQIEKRDTKLGLSLGTKKVTLPLVIATTNLKQPVSTFYKKPRDWDTESISMSDEDMTKATHLGAPGSSNLSEDSFEIILERFYNSVNY